MKKNANGGSESPARTMRVRTIWRSSSRLASAASRAASAASTAAWRDSSIASTSAVRASSIASFTAWLLAPGGTLISTPPSLVVIATKGADAADAAPEAVAALAALAAEAAFGARALGPMRTPFLSIEIVTASSLLSFGPFSAVTSGAFGALGAAAPAGARLRFGASRTTVSVQLPGRMPLRMPAHISSSNESTKKRFQLMPTSQFA